MLAATHANKVRALYDPWVFADLINFQGGSEQFSDIHRKMMYFTARPQLYQSRAKVAANYYCSRRMLLLPRGHLKSTVCVTLYTLWRIYRNPNLRILFATNVKELSWAFIRELRAYFEDEDLQEKIWNNRPHIKGRLVPVMDNSRRRRQQLAERGEDPDNDAQDKKITWSSTTLQVMRWGNFKAKEPTVFATSTGTKVTGQHYDLLFLDDIVDFDNSRSKESCDKVISWAEDMESIVDPTKSVTIGSGTLKITEDIGDEVVITGTKYSSHDLYHLYLKEKKAREIRTMQRNVYRNSTDSSDGYLWPERFVDAVVQRLRARLSNKRFASQYLNRIIADEDIVINRNKIQYFASRCMSYDDKTNIWTLVTPAGHKLPIRLCMVVDPAISVNSKADYTAITVGAMAYTHDLIVVDSRVMRAKPNDVIKAIYDMAAKWHLFSVTVESVGFQRLLADNIRNWVDRPFPMVVREYAPPRLDKKIRITERLQPLVDNNQVWFSDWLASVEIINTQLDTFQYENAHDDFPDTLEILCSVSKAIGVGTGGKAVTPHRIINRKFGGTR